MTDSTSKTPTMREAAQQALRWLEADHPAAEILRAALAQQPAPVKQPSSTPSQALKNYMAADTARQMEHFYQAFGRASPPTKPTEQS